MEIKKYNSEGRFMRGHIFMITSHCSHIENPHGTPEVV